MNDFLKYKKHFQIAGVIFSAIVLYWLLKKDPVKAHKLILSGNEYIKYLPIDSTTSSIITPIINLTSKWNSSTFSNGGGMTADPRQKAGITKMMNSGGGGSFGGGGGGGDAPTKRSVSESKKKYVAANQDWTCHNCREKLKATFEVDHIIPLFKGGTNHIDNLRALCLECHRNHTISDKL